MTEHEFARQLRYLDINATLRYGGWTFRRTEHGLSARGPDGTRTFVWQQYRSYARQVAAALAFMRGVPEAREERAIRYPRKSGPKPKLSHCKVPGCTGDKAPRSAYCQRHLSEYRRLRRHGQTPWWEGVIG